MRALVSTLILALALVAAAPALAGTVNINTADVKTLAKELDGIGAERAKAIIAYREKNGPFKSADDLKKVQGVGPAIVERNRAKIVTDDGKVLKTNAGGG
jgi:competence protein ComEA